MAADNGGTSGDLERLGVVVVGEGIEETKASLLSLGEAGEASAAKAGRAASQGATQFAQSFTDGAGKAAAATEQAAARMQAAFVSETAAAQRAAQERVAVTERAQAQATAAATRNAAIEARTAAEAYVATLQREFAGEQARIKEGIARGFITTAEARIAGREAALAYNQGVIAAIDKGAAAGAFTSKNGQAAFTELAGSLKAVEGPARNAGATFNALRSATASMATAAIGAAPGVTQLASVVSTFSLGALTTAGILVGITAVSYGWQKWSEQARKAKDEQDQLTASLAKWYETQRNGEAGSRQLQVRATESLLGQQQAQLTGLQDLLSNPQIAVRSGFDPADLKRRADALKAQMDEGRRIVAAGNADIARTISEGDVQRRNEEASNLATLIAAHQASEKERARAIAVLREQQALLVAYSKPPAGANQQTLDFFLKQRADIAASAKALQDALTGKPDRLAGPSAESPERQAVLDALGKQLDALRAVNVENNTEIQKAKDQATLLGAEGLARDLLVNRIHAETEAEKARTQYAGVALVERLRGIQVAKEEEDARLRGVDAIRTREAALRELARLEAEVAATGAKNAKTTGAELSEGLRATLAPLQELQRGLERDFARSIAAGLKEGFGSLKGLLDSSSRLFDDFASHVISSKISDALFTKVDPSGKITNTGALSIADQKTLGQFAIAAVAVTGFANALNNLTGATNRTAEQLDQQIRSFLSLQSDLATYRASIAGGPIASSLLQNTNDAQRLRDEINAALPGRRLEGERNARLAEIDALEAQKREQIAREFWASIAAGLNALNGPAGALQNQIDALTKSYTENLAAAAALGGSTDDITKLYQAQVAAAKAAYAEGQRRQQEDLEVRRLTAIGGTSRQIDDARFAFGQRREIADLQSQNAPKELIDQVLAIQKLEQERRAADFAALEQQAQEDYRVRQLAAEGHTAEAEALRLQLDQQREYDAAVKAGLDDATLAALTLAQTAEAAAAAAKQAQDAQRALDDLQVRALAAQGDQTAADALRFQLQQQRELEDAIAAGRSQEYIDKLKEVQALEAKAREQAAGTVNNTAVARQQTGQTEAVSYAARNLSEVTGNRMADYLASILIVERQQLDVLRGGTGAAFTRSFVAPAPGAVPFYAQPLGYGENRGVQPASVAGIDVNALAAVLAPRLSSPRTSTAPTADARPFRVVIDHNINAITGKIDRGDLRSLITEIADDLTQELIRRADLQRLADGSPLLSGR